MPAGLVEQQDGMRAGFNRLSSIRCSAIAAMLQRGRTNPAAAPRAGQMAPNR